jgi:hypothetical protein
MSSFLARLTLQHPVLTAFFAFVTVALSSHGSAQIAAPSSAEAGTSTDLFVMIGSDFDRPGLLPRSNYNIGIGHTFGFLKKDPIGDELTFGYTYENAGTHGWLHTPFGEHTESAGVMKNFGLPGTKIVTGYTWLQSGITTVPPGSRRAIARSSLSPGTPPSASAIPTVGEPNNPPKLFLLARGTSQFPQTPGPAISSYYFCANRLHPSHLLRKIVGKVTCAECYNGIWSELQRRTRRTGPTSLRGVF